MKVVDKPNVIYVNRNGSHRKSSHAQDRSAFLKVAQQDVVKGAVRYYPLASGSTVRRYLKHLNPQQEVPPELKKSVQRLVNKEKVKVLAQELDGVKMDGSFGSVAALAEAK